MARRKRSRDEFEQRSTIGMGETLSRLNGPRPSSAGSESARDGHGDGDSGDWHRVESSNPKRRKKLPKKESDNYPSIRHSSHARLQSFVKLSDLQNLVLYLLADGNAPQWVSVRHHGAVRKVVVLMVPGLEADMFDGRITLSPVESASMLQPIKEELTMKEESKDNVLKPAAEPSSISTLGAGRQNGSTVPADSSELAQTDSKHTSHPTSRLLHIARHGPDAYYPTKLMHNRVPQPLAALSDTFEHIWPVRTPGDDKNARMHSPLASILTVPLVKTKEEKRAKGPQPPPEGRGWENKRTSITELLATTQELAEEGYVLHPAHYHGTKIAVAETAKREIDKTTAAHGWVDSLGIESLSDGDVPDRDIEKGSVTAGRKVLAMDCEMCITSPPGVTPQVFSLTRVAIIDWNGQTILDELVKPDEPITDYLTPYSGITAAMLENVTTTLPDIQKRMLSILTPHTILVGHSLNSDLNALKLTHPFIIDTAFLFPHPRGPPLKSSLKWLAQKYLVREIQKGHGSTGHNSIEDAKASLDLVKQKCEKGKAWGTSEASGESIFKRLGRSIRPKREKVNPIGDDEARIGAVVDWGEPARGYGSQAKVAIGCESDADVVAGVKRSIEGDDDNAIVPKGGCDFIWARLRELEAHRGWWNQSKLVDTDALRTSSKANSAESSLSELTAQTAKHINDIYEVLPPCTAFIVYSGSGDPRELSEMQSMQQKFKEEYRTKKWDELSVRWTDVEEQKLRKACEKARMGIGFITVK